MADMDPINADFARKSPDSFARILGRGDASDIHRILETLPPEVVASVVSRLPASRTDLLLAADQEEPTRWVADAPYEDAVTLLGRMARERCLILVNSLDDRERRRRLLRYLNYPTHSVGALVSDVTVRFAADTPASDVLDELRALDIDRPEALVVLRPDGRYLGLLDLWKLLACDPPVGPIRDYVLAAPVLRPETSLVAAVHDPDWHVHNWLPVVDHEQRVLGGVSRATVVRAAARHLDVARRRGHLVTELATEMVLVFGELLDRILTRRHAS